MNVQVLAKSDRLARRREAAVAAHGRVTGRWGGRRACQFTDEDVRAMRWWACSDEASSLSQRAQARTLAARYHARPTTMADILSHRSYAGIDGPPLSARYWQGQEHDGWMAALIWIVFLAWFSLTSPSR